jgi:hypothetical protein
MFEQTDSLFNSTQSQFHQTFLTNPTQKLLYYCKLTAYLESSFLWTLLDLEN